MSKTSKILTLVISIAFLLVLYLIMSSQIITVKPSETALVPPVKEVVPQKVEKIDLQELEANYKEKITQIFKEFELVLNDFWEISGTSTDNTLINSEATITTSSEANIEEEEVLEKISELKINLMDLTVPEQFRDLHLGLVLSFSKIKNSIENESEVDKSDGLALIKQAKTEYEWLTQ